MQYRLPEMPLQGLRVTKTSTAKFLNGTLKAADYKDLIQVVHTYGNVRLRILPLTQPKLRKIKLNTQVMRFA